MNDISGILLEPKRFAIHDGPGIRTAFFFKGCVLKCLWCHNPESISPHPQLGYFDSKCIACGDCAELCPANAHTFTEERHRIDRNACTLCGKCTGACPGAALKIYGKVITVEEAVKIALADRTFYQESGGGVTLSGGEPLLQLAFAAALLKALKSENLHTALDSCACVSTSAFEQIFPYTDLFLIDFKHAISSEHRRLTGMGNELVLQNLQYLSDRGGRIEIRIPVVPGCNDSPENMQKTAEILAKIHPESVRLLPYHSLAGGKYRAVDMPDTMPQVPSPGGEQLAVFAGVLQKSGLTVRF